MEVDRAISADSGRTPLPADGEQPQFIAVIGIQLHERGAYGHINPTIGSDSDMRHSAEAGAIGPLDVTARIYFDGARVTVARVIEGCGNVINTRQPAKSPSVGTVSFLQPVMARAKEVAVTPDRRWCVYALTM